MSKEILSWFVKRHWFTWCQTCHNSSWSFYNQDSQTPSRRLLGGWIVRFVSSTQIASRDLPNCGRLRASASRRYRMLLDLIRRDREESSWGKRGGGGLMVRLVGRGGGGWWGSWFDGWCGGCPWSMEKMKMKIACVGPLNYDEDL